jgi:hypothetical protein
MCQQLGQLEIIDTLPVDIGKYEAVVNRGLDIRSACMVYLGIHIRHDATPLGNVGEFRIARNLIDTGKFVKTVLVGDEKISNSEGHLQKAIDNYTIALSTFHTGVTIKVLEVVNSTLCLLLRITNFPCSNCCFNPSKER